MSSVSATINCNLNCICMNSDCLYNHYLPYKERKIVKKFYEDISNKNINEEGMDMRKKNCIFGQLCEKKTCGYKHRLSFPDREKLIVSYKFNKICPGVSQVAKTSNTKSDKPQMNIHNMFSPLHEKEIEEVQEEIVINSWASIVKNTKSISLATTSTVSKEIKEVHLNWEDCADEDFYMEFE